MHDDPIEGEFIKIHLIKNPLLILPRTYFWSYKLKGSTFHFLSVFLLKNSLSEGEKMEILSPEAFPNFAGVSESVNGWSIKSSSILFTHSFIHSINVYQVTFTC